MTEGPDTWNKQEHLSSLGQISLKAPLIFKVSDHTLVKLETDSSLFFCLYSLPDLSEDIRRDKR